VLNKFRTHSPTILPLIPTPGFLTSSDNFKV